MHLIAIIAATFLACENHLPKENDYVDLAECHHFPGTDNWYTCPEGKVSQIVHREPDGATQIIMIADAGRVFWLNPQVRTRRATLGELHRWMLADDDQDDGIAIKTVKGVVTEITAW